VRSNVNPKIHAYIMSRLLVRLAISGSSTRPNILSIDSDHMSVKVYSLITVIACVIYNLSGQRSPGWQVPTPCTKGPQHKYSGQHLRPTYMSQCMTSESSVGAARPIIASCRMMKGEMALVMSCMSILGHSTQDN